MIDDFSFILISCTNFNSIKTRKYITFHHIKFSHSLYLYCIFQKYHIKQSASACTNSYRTIFDSTSSQDLPYFIKNFSWEQATTITSCVVFKNSENLFYAIRSNSQSCTSTCCCCV